MYKSLKKIFSSIFSFVFALNLLACATTPKKYANQDAFFSTDGWLIQPGAKINILVQGEPNFSKKDLIVEPDGTLSYTPMGRFNVSNYTDKQLQEYIKKYLSETIFHNPNVSVTVDYNAKIYILGEVKNPGIYEINKPITVLEAVKLAGNFSDQSLRDVIKLVRQTAQGETIKTISLKKIDFIWIKNENIYISPNDVLMVN